MKKIPTFTLVRKPGPLRAEAVESQNADGVGLSPADNKKARAAKTAKAALDAFTKLGEKAVLSAVNDTRLRKVYSSLDENFKATLRSTFGSSAADLLDQTSEIVAKNVKKITEELSRGEKVLRVGILDLGAWVPGLPDFLEKLNKSQDMFTMFEILAPIPGGLVKTSEGFQNWLAEHSGKPDVEMAKEKANAPHMIFDDFYVAAEDIRSGMGLDLLVAVTPYMVAGTQDGQPFWNHFTATEGGCILVSVADLRDFAEQAGRPFEAAIGILLVASLFVTVNDDLDFHEVDTGCVFDYNQRRESLVDTIKAMTIDNECYAKMNAVEMQAAKSMLSVLKRMKKRGLK